MEDRRVLERRLAKLCGVWLGIGGGIVTDITSGGNGGVKLDGREKGLPDGWGQAETESGAPFNNRSSGMSN
jgi:hypothetical protein